MFGIAIFSGCGVIDDFAGGDDDKLETAYIYKNRETGKLVYCSNDQGEETTDFRYVGTSKVKSKNIKLCALKGGKPL